jgi:hypothetical protein
VEQAVRVDYRNAAKSLDVFGLNMSHTEVGRLLTRVANEVRTELYGPDAIVTAASRMVQNPPALMSIQPDGSRYRTNEADKPRRTPAMSPDDRGYRENKICAVSRLEPGVVGNDGSWQPPQELVKTYVATTKDVHAFGQQVRTEADRRGVKQATEVVAVCDNGHGNREMLQREFEDVDIHHVADFFHAAGRIGEVVSIVDAAAGKAARWSRFKSLKDMLWNGDVHRVSEQLRAFASKRAPQPAKLSVLDSRPEAKTLWEHTLYFERNSGMMDYPTYRERGWPIASSSIESACSQFGDRVKHARMRWTRAGADAVHVLKAAVLSHDDRWTRRWPGAIPVLEWARGGEAN